MRRFIAIFVILLFCGILYTAADNIFASMGGGMDMDMDMGMDTGGDGSGPLSGSGLLLESPADSFLILETGDYLLLE